MASERSNRSTTIRATYTSYCALSGVWILLAVGYLLLAFRTPGHNLESGALIAGGVAVIWVMWLRGFKITLSDGCVEYRDGFFRSSKVTLSDIADVKTDNIEWNVLGRRIGVPRLVVIRGNGEVAIRINPKPFARHALQRILMEMNKAVHQDKP